MTERSMLAAGLVILLALSGCQGKTTEPFSDAAEAIKSLDERDQTVLAAEELDGFQPDDVEKRHALGEAHLLNTYPGWAEPDGLRRYVQGVLDEIMTAGGVEGPSLKVRVTATPNTDASATKFGVLHVSLGMLNNLKTEDELAFVLAHEAAHILLGHHKSGLLDKAAIYGAHVGKLASFAGALPEGEDLDLAPMLASATAAIVSRDLIAPAWNRSQETEADLLAADLMVEAGFKVDAYDSVMQLLAQAEKQTGPPRVTLTAVERQLFAGVDVPESQGKSDEGAPSSLEGVLSEAVGTGKKVLDKMRKNHPKPDARRTTLMKYVRRFHLDAPRPDMRVTPYRRVVEQPAVTAALERMDLANQANKAQKEGDTASAVRIARKAVSGVGAHDPFARSAFAGIRRAQGRHEKEIANLRYALQSEAAGLALYSDLARAYREMGQYQRAWQTVERAREKFAEPKSLLPKRIRIAMRAGYQEQARLLNAKCQLAIPKVAHRCQRSLNGEPPLLEAS